MKVMKILKVLISLRPLSSLSIRKEIEKYDVVVYGIWEDVGECSEETEMDIVVKDQEIIPQIEEILRNGNFNLSEAGQKVAPLEKGKIFYTDGDICKVGPLFKIANAEVVYA